MRWLRFILLAYVAVVVHTSVGAVLSVSLPSAGVVLRVDLLAALAVIFILAVRSRDDAVLAAWVLGLLADLTTLATPVGLYALTFALAAAVVCRLRGAVFIQHPLAQIVLALVFCLLAHGLAVLAANVYPAAGRMLWRELSAAATVSLCTAAATPLLCRALARLTRAVVAEPVRRR